ncbi:MAG: hypothetical protein ACK5C0_10755 [Candidatus Kapaibacterium sp.]|jgi:hypothetical protein
MASLLGKIAKKLFETEYNFKKNGFEKSDQWKTIKVGDTVEYGVTATDGITYRVEDIDAQNQKARIKCLSNVKHKNTGEYYTVSLKMIRPV